MSGTLTLEPAIAGDAGKAERVPRVLFVDHSSRLAGAELILLDILRGRAGADVFLFENGDLRTELARSGVQARVSRRAADFSRVKRDRSLLRAVPLAGAMAAVVFEIAAAARRADILYANSQKAFVLAAPAALLARRPLIWHLHDILDGAHFAGAQRRLVIGMANRLAARVIVPSQATADAFVAAGGDRTRVRIAPNGVSLLPEPADRAALRREFGLPDGFIFGVFSRLASWKGQHVALAALAELPDAHCLIVGDALFGETGYAAELRETADRLGVSSRVRFLGHRRDVPRLMRAVDAVVHPSVEAEPFGRTVVEAMLCRTPVIATATGAVPEILDHGRAGTLVPAGDAPSLAAAIAKLASGVPDLCGRLDRAESRARALYGANAMRAAVAAVIADVASGGRV